MEDKGRWGFGSSQSVFLPLPAQPSPRPGVWRGWGDSGQSLSSLRPLVADHQASRPWYERDGRAPRHGQDTHSWYSGTHRGWGLLKATGSGTGRLYYNAGFQIVRGLSSSDPHVFLWGPNPLPLLPNMDLGTQPLLIWAAIGHPLDREQRTRCSPKLDSGGWGVAGGWHGKGSAGVSAQLLSKAAWHPAAPDSGPCYLTPAAGSHLNLG